MISRQIFYSGRVQGVGFRAAVKRLAAGYEVTGTVKNLADGRVEVCVSAQDSDELHEFIEAVKDSDLASLIRDHEVHIIPPMSGVRGFTIVT